MKEKKKKEIQREGEKEQKRKDCHLSAVTFVFVDPNLKNRK